MILVAAPACVSAEDDESLTGKAASQLISSMPEFFKDVVALQQMTPAQKVDYILTQSEGRIGEKVAEKVKEDMLAASREYVKEMLRAKLFTDDALPKIKNAYAMGEKFDWSVIDSSINSKLDTRMNALASGLGAASVGWDVIQACRAGTVQDGVSKIAGAFSKAMAEAYIPGWGVIELSAELMQVLVQYILSYSTETAVEGMLEDMFRIKAAPRDFAKWVLDKSPEQIAKDIDDKWNWGAGYGRLWEGQGTDKGDEAMKLRIRQAVVDLRSKLVLKKREEEQKQAEVRRMADQYYLKARQSKDKVRAIADKAYVSADPSLQKIRDFRIRINGVAKEQYKKDAAAIEAQIEKNAEDEWVKQQAFSYVSLPHASLLSDLEALLLQISDSIGSGYDPDGSSEPTRSYEEKRKQAVASHQQTVSKTCADAAAKEAQIYETYAPQLKEICSVDRDRCWEMAAAMRREQQPYVAVQLSHPKQLAQDYALLGTEEAAAFAGARQRGTQVNENIKTLLTDLSSRIRTAAEAYEQVNQQNGAERGTASEIYQNFIYAAPSQFDAPLNPREPGDLVREQSYYQEGLALLIEGEKKEAVFVAREKQALSMFLGTVANVENLFVVGVPKKLQEIKSIAEGHIHETLQIKRFDMFVSNNSINVIDGGSITIPRMWGSGTPEDATKRMAENSALITTRISLVKKRLAMLEDPAAADAQMLTASSLASRLGTIPNVYLLLERSLDEETKLATDLFRQKSSDKSVYELLDPKSSLGEQRLAELTQSWKTHSDAIERLDLVVRQIGKRVTYQYDYLTHFKNLAVQLLLLPKRIAVYEKEKSAAESRYSSRIAAAGKYLEENELRYAELQKADFSPELTVADSRTLHTTVAEYLKSYQRWTHDPKIATLIPRWEALEKQTAKLVTDVEKMADAYVKAAPVPKEPANEPPQAPSETDAGGNPSTIATVRDLYAGFKGAYESRNESQIMSYLGDDWQAGDGTTLADLQATFSRMFRVFDEIRFDMNSLTIQPTPQGFMATYDVSITSRIFSRNIKHVEKSQVNELVAVDAQGKPRITRTLNGRFWYVE